MLHNINALTKRRFIFYGFVLFLIQIISLDKTAGQTVPPRQRININREWKFILGDQKNAEQTSFQDTAWENVNLPHSFSTPYFQTGQWYVGYGWYRKYINAPANWKGKRLFIEFEGAFRDAEIFVNGKPVGHHKSGYTGFCYDITDAMVTGRNVLAVRLNNLWDARLAPRDGDHIFCGGIYRDVYLVVTNPAHVTWYGTFVTTPKVSKTSGTINIKTEVTNTSGTSKIYRLKTTVLDPLGKVADVFSSSLKISNGDTVVFNQTGHAIPHPKLWHPLHPYLYKTVSTLYDGKRLVDRYETNFGFRWVEWTADKGFFLNGEHYYFKGVNVHQDHAGWANAVTNQGFVRDINMVKEAGFDFIRGSHYPHDPAFSDACDSLGIMLWSENNFWGSGNFSKEGSWFDRSGAYPVKPEDRAAYEESVKTSLTEMIRIHRNHPAIVTWSMGNEDFFAEQSTLPLVRNFLKELVALTHQLDPSRKAAIGGVQRGEIDKIGDIAGYNGDGARLYLNPGVPNVVSEYGSTTEDRPGKYSPGWGDLQQEQFDWRSGQVLWCGFDYGTHYGDGAFGHMGMIDYFRLPKRMWYWYRNEYRHIPPPEWPKDGVPSALSLTADKTIISNTNGTDDVQIIVTVLDKNGKAISNNPDVTLKLESGPGEFPTGNAITFSAKSDIAIRDGKAAIEFRSYYGGESVIRATSPGLKDAIIRITTKGLPIFIPGKTNVAPAVSYIKYRLPINALSADTGINRVYQKPTKASSEATEHSARMANDQNETTYWAAKPNFKENWWQVDMESLITVQRVKLDFPSVEKYQYKVQVSLDGISWQDIFETQQDGAASEKKVITIPNAPLSRFLKIVFNAGPSNKHAALTEVEVYGRDE